MTMSSSASRSNASMSPRSNAAKPLRTISTFSSDIARAVSRDIESAASHAKRNFRGHQFGHQSERNSAQLRPAPRVR
jgi:hypothetical protein